MRSGSAYWTLLIAAMLVHAGILGWAHIRGGGIDASAFRSLDCNEYFVIARNLAQHAAFSQDSAPPLTPDTWRTPGYPLFLAAVMLATGDSPTALILAQQLLAILNVVLFFRMVLRYLSPRASALASFIVLFEPYHLLYSLWLLSTTFFTFMLLVLWWLWERARTRASWWHYPLIGLASGFVVLTWPGAILIPLVLVAALFLQQRRNDSMNRPYHRKYVALALAITGCALPPLAWMTRNKMVAGHFALSHQSGIVLAYFKATEVELWAQGRVADRYVETSLNPDSRQKPHPVWEEIDRKLCERLTLEGGQPNCDDLRWYNIAQGNKTSRDSFQISKALAEIGGTMLRNQPVQAIACGMTRIGENMVFPLGQALSPANETQVHRPKAFALGIVYLVLVMASIVGAIRARCEWRTILFPIACIIALALTTAPQIDPRFRVPLIPLIAFLALIPWRFAKS